MPGLEEQAGKKNLKLNIRVAPRRRVRIAVYRPRFSWHTLQSISNRRTPAAVGDDSRMSRFHIQADERLYAESHQLPMRGVHSSCCLMAIHLVSRARCDTPGAWLCMAHRGVRERVCSEVP